MDIEGGAIPLCDHSTGFLEDQFSSGHVPGGEFHFKKALKAAGGGVGKIDGGGSKAADGDPCAENVDEMIDAVMGIFGQVIGKTGR